MLPSYWLFCIGTVSHVAQAGLEFAVELGITLNCSSSLPLLAHCWKYKCVSTHSATFWKFCGLGWRNWFWEFMFFVKAQESEEQTPFKTQLLSLRWYYQIHNIFYVTENNEPVLLELWKNGYCGRKRLIDLNEIIIIC